MESASLWNVDVIKAVLEPISASNTFHNHAVRNDAIILSGTVNRPRRKKTLQNSNSSNRNPLHDVPGDLLLPAIVEPRGARVGVAGQMLHLFEGYALFEQIRDDGDAERMR
jgi:hypothetical protein